MTEHKFIEGTKFDGVWYPRFDSRPNGPQTQSFCRCKCGQHWNKHRTIDGACPVQQKGEQK